METARPPRPKPAQAEGVPPRLGRFFWDCDPAALSLRRHRNFIIYRLLDQGDWEAIRWLRQRVGDDAIRGRRRSRRVAPRAEGLPATVVGDGGEETRP